MARLFWLLLTAVLAAPAAGAAAEPPVTLFVQYIRGTNDQKPKDPKWKLIGPKLSKRLSPVFRWQNYWEVSQQAVTVQNAKVNMVPLSESRRLELELVNGKEVEMRVYQNRNLTRKARQPLHSNHMEIIGGSWDRETCWIVVVRHDKPQSQNGE